MSRRRFIALISLCMLVMLGLIGLGVGLVATRSDRGQAALRGWVQARVRSNIHGKLHLGRVSGNFFTGIEIDSLELRDDEDSLFVATGRIRLQYDPRDLVDRRLHFRQVEVENPVVVLRQHENWSWNFKRMFKSGPPNSRNGPERGFGDFIAVDSTHIRNASFRLTVPWHADDSLHGARRDSAIRANVARKDHEIRRTREGYTQTYRWTKAYAAVPYARITDPDSAGMLFKIDTLHTDESVPTFKWRNVAGVVRILGDTVWIKAPHWDLPGSTGRAEGRVSWGSDLPVRYALRIWGDSVSLADVAWVYPTLPTTGGGRMVLDIKNERNLNQLDYAISDMDVRTTKSRLRGAMTFETGNAVLSVHDVKVLADPVDWDLLRTLNGKPFPADWQGTLTGTVTARGGPLNRFFVDAANITFRDAHVRGAVSHMTGHGELDILLPAFTAFHHFTASTDRFDLRSITRIYPAFPKIGGIVTGSAVLDSSWLDVRVSNANLTHTDGPAEPTHATGGGRITYGTKYMSYDLDLLAAPLSLTTLARSYPKLPLRGTFAGPVTVKGMAPDLQVQADLTGAAGHLLYTGRVDADSVGGYGAHGSGSFDALNAAALMGVTTPPSRLAGEYDVDLTGDSSATLVGWLALRLGKSEVDGTQLASGTSRVRFDNGIVHIDTVRVDGVPGTLRARGTLGLTRSAGSDSLVVSVDVDSLGGLRRYLKGGVSFNGTPLKADTLLGSLAFRGSVRGWLDSLDVRGALVGKALHVRDTRARGLQGTLALRSVRGRTTGSVDLRADTVIASGVRVRSASLDARILDQGRATFGVGAMTSDGDRLRGAGQYTQVGDTTRVQLDTMSLAIGASRWTLRRPAHLVTSPVSVVLDTLVLADANGARIDGYVRVPNAAAPARGHFQANGVPLADLGRLAQLASPLDGRLDADLDISGTRERPTMMLNAAARALKVGPLFLETFMLTGGYGDERAKLQANLLRGGRSILDASVDYPIALTLFSARPVGDSLRGRIHADSVDLALVEAMSSKVRNTAGRVALDLAISGAPNRPHVGGMASVSEGAIEIPDAGVRFAAIDGMLRVDATRDSLAIEHLQWTSPASGGTGALSGSIVFRDLDNPTLDLRLNARLLRVVDKRSLARLDVSTARTGLTLQGTMEEATLSGAVNVDKGTIYIPELIRKELVELTADDFAMFFDTTDVRNRSLMPAAPGKLVEHLRLAGVSVNLGDEVWLKSKEANIKLGGSLNVTRARDDRESGRSSLDREPFADTTRITPKYTLALSGTLSADRGTYALDLDVVKREFQVQSGRITFFGTPDFNPAIDVTAVYNVKQSNRADIAVQARIFGNFYPQPSLRLSSTDASISSSDLVSYLVTGRPSADLTNNAGNNNTQRAMEFLLPTVSASLSQALRNQIGFMDLFYFQSGAVSDPTTSAQNPKGQFDFLYQTRLGGEKQISDRLFLSFSTGLCPFASSTGTSDQNQGLKGFGNAIEGKLEYRFPLAGADRFALRAGREPSANALRCGTGGDVRGFVQTPQQWGLSLFRSWSF
jgi:translocation and assembly module TamB